MGRTACTELQCLYKGALYIYFYVADRKTRPNGNRHIFFPLEFILLYSLGWLWILISVIAALTSPLTIRRVTNERLSDIGGFIDSDTLEYLSQGHFVYQQSHTECALSEPALGGQRLPA